MIICVTCPFGTEIYTFRSHPDKLSALSRAYSKPITVKSKIENVYTACNIIAQSDIYTWKEVREHLLYYEGTI